MIDQTIQFVIEEHLSILDFRSRVGAVVRVLASNQCVPSLIPGLQVTCGLTLLVPYPALQGFSLGTPVSIPISSKTSTVFDFILFDLS